MSFEQKIIINPSDKSRVITAKKCTTYVMSIDDNIQASFFNRDAYLRYIKLIRLQSKPIKRQPKSRKARIRVYEKCKGFCSYCGRDLDFKNMVMDYIFPLSIGGIDEVENMNPSCKSCLDQKKNLTVEEFRIELFDKIRVEIDNSSNLRVLKRFKLVEIKSEEPVFFFEKMKYLK